MEQKYKITATLELSFEYFTLLCQINNIELDLSEEKKLEKLNKLIHANLVYSNVTPIENYIRGQAILQAQAQIDEIKEKAQNNIITTIEPQ